MFLETTSIGINIQDIFSLRNIIIYLIVINVLGFLSMFIDKKKAEYGRWRIPENTLFLFTFLGGTIGSIIGMQVFRHKTKKNKFRIGMPLLLVLQIIAIIIFVVL